MIPFVATHAALELPELSCSQPKQVHLAKMAMSDSAPWLYAALSQLRELENTGMVIRGLGDLRIPEETATSARMLLSLIDIVDLPVPDVAPVSGGGLSIVWAMGPREVKFSFYPNDQARYFKITDDEILNDGQVNFAQPKEVSEPLRWMSDTRP